MHSKDIQHIIEKFDIQRQLDNEHFKNLEELRSSFTKDFSIASIQRLSLDEYIEGKGSHSSFCYRLERQLDKLGNMRGSTSAVFVVYFGKDGKDSIPKYRFTSKLGKVSNEHEALENVKLEIVRLIEAGRNNDEEEIKNNRLADLFKYKILGTYYPSTFLNLYSHRHLDYFIGQLGLNPEHKSVLDKQKALLNFKNSDEIMVNWSNLEFNSFLYSTFGRPPSKEQEKQNPDFLPAIQKIRPEIINLSILDKTNTDFKKGKGKAKPNYEEKNELNNRLGKRGENIVFNIEKEFLIKNKIPLDNLVHASKTDDRLGYDIQSVDEEGKIKFIEVKSTRRKKGNANFIITENEKEKAENLENYYIYIVFEAHTLSPKIWIINEPFKKYRDKLKLTPVNYRVEINTKI